MIIVLYLGKDRNTPWPLHVRPECIEIQVNWKLHALADREVLGTDQYSYDEKTGELKLEVELEPGAIIEVVQVWGKGNFGVVDDFKYPWPPGTKGNSWRGWNQ